MGVLRKPLDLFGLDKSGDLSLQSCLLDPPLCDIGRFSKSKLQISRNHVFRLRMILLIQLRKSCSRIWIILSQFWKRLLFNRFGLLVWVSSFSLHQAIRYLGNREGSVTNPGRGYGRSGFGSRGRRDFYRSGSRLGHGSSFWRKQGGSSSFGPNRDSGLGSQAQWTAIPVMAVNGELVLGSQVAEPAGKNLINPSVMAVNGADIVHRSFPSEEGSSQIRVPSKEIKVDANEVLLGEAQLEDGEFYTGSAENDFNGELEDFAEFDGEFEFGVGEEFGDGFGEDDVNYEDDAVTRNLIAVGNKMADDVEFSKVDIIKDPMVFGHYSGNALLVPDEKELPDVASVLEKDLQAKRDCKKRQVGGSGPLVSANSKKRNVALLSSPRRKVPQKSGVGVKERGKDKDGKVAIPKLPGDP